MRFPPMKTANFPASSVWDRVYAAAASVSNSDFSAELSAHGIAQSNTGITRWHGKERERDSAGASWAQPPHTAPSATLAPSKITSIPGNGGALGSAMTSLCCSLPLFPCVPGPSSHVQLLCPSTLVPVLRPASPVAGGEPGCRLSRERGTNGHSAHPIFAM